MEGLQHYTLAGEESGCDCVTMMDPASRITVRIGLRMKVPFAQDSYILCTDQVKDVVA